MSLDVINWPNHLRVIKVIKSTRLSFNGIPDWILVKEAEK